MENKSINLMYFLLLSALHLFKTDRTAEVRKLCCRLSALKQPADGVRHSPGCVSETSKKEERRDLGQRVSEQSVKWTPTQTKHTSLLALQSLNNVT